MHITTQLKTDPYQELLNEKGGSGFPFLAVLDIDGSVLDAEVTRSLEGLRAAVARGQAFVDLRKRASTKNAPMAVRVDYFLRRLDRGLITAATARAELTKLELSAEQRAATEPQLVALEFHEIEARIEGKKDYATAGAAFAAMKVAGRIPAGGRSARMFWQFICIHAKQENDVALFDDCVVALEPLLRGKKSKLEKLHKSLEKLRAGKK